MKTTTIRAAFAVFLAVATLAGGNARAEISVFGACMTLTENNPFDGDSVVVGCLQDKLANILVIHCMNNTTELWVAPRNKRMLKEGLSLRTALDDTETTSWGWEVRDNPNRLSIKPAIPIIKQMLGHSRFRFRITEGNGEVHNGDIDISSLGEAIAPVRALCEW